MYKTVVVRAKINSDKSVDLRLNSWNGCLLGLFNLQMSFGDVVSFGRSPL